MPPDMNSIVVKPIPALPLEYETDGSALFRQMIRAISFVLMIVGCCEVASYGWKFGWAFSDLGRRMFNTYWFLPVNYLLEILVAVLQIVVGWYNRKSPSHLFLFGIWAWMIIGARALQVVLQCLGLFVDGPSGTSYDSLMMILGFASDLPVYWMFPVVILILLHYHKRLIGQKVEGVN